MIKPGKILLIFVLLLSISYLGCERIDPHEREGDGEEFQTLEEKDVIFLSPDIYTYLGVVDGMHIFEVSGSPVLPSLGSLVYFTDEDNCISGKVEEMQTGNNVLRIRLSLVPVNDFFTYLALKIDLDELGFDYFNIYPGCGRQHCNPGRDLRTGLCRSDAGLFASEGGADCKHKCHR